MTIEERLESVERQLAQAKRRSMALLVAVCVLGAAWVLWLSIDTVQAETGTPEVVRARRFEVVDEEGKTCARLVGGKDRTGLEFRDEQGTSRAQLGVAKGAAWLSLSDEKGTQRVTLGTPKEGPKVVLRDEKGEPLVALLSAKEIGVGLCVYDGKCIRALLGLYEGSPGLELYDENEMARAMLKVTENGAIIKLSGENGKTHAVMGVREDVGVVGLIDKKGKVIWSAP